MLGGGSRAYGGAEGEAGAHPEDQPAQLPQVLSWTELVGLCLVANLLLATLVGIVCS